MVTIVGDGGTLIPSVALTLYTVIEESAKKTIIAMARVCWTILVGFILYASFRWSC
jgi:hypothetical protein